MPDSTYFRQPTTQDMMLDILFIFCKLNPDIGYRQGMHEILAPILWVVERDALKSGAAETQASGDRGTDLLVDLIDSQFIEHDSFTLYSLVMHPAKTFYAPAESSSRSSKESPMLIRSSYIFEKLLPRVDPQLAAHLTKLEIVPQIFLLRWIRLLFGREFPLDEVLDMWDALFAIDPSLELVNTISIAMLLRIRWQLLNADTNMAFTLLLKYPEHEAPAFTFIKDALYLRDHLTPEGGIEIVSRYSNKVPILEKAPIQSPLPDRNRPSSTSSRNSFAQQGTIEALIQGAAKGVIERGEKWGVGKAIRDAVGEIKKNVDSLQSGPGTPRSGGREFRKPARLAMGGTLTGPQKAYADKAISILDSRNKNLAKMLQGAVSELWDYHKERSETAEVKESLEALTTAIAKVQFVQVYLEDSSIPLPADESMEPAASSPKAVSPLERTSSAPVLATSSTSSPIHPGRSSLLSPARDRNDMTLLDRAGSPLSQPQSAKLSALSPRNRPPLAQSSFSWMLGESDSSAAFASASAHTAFPSDEKRRMKGSVGGKGYLFGDDEDGGKEGKGKARSARGEVEIEEEVIDLSPMGKGAVM
jgi:TBC1 domain family protein 5